MAISCKECFVLTMFVIALQLPNKNTTSLHFTKIQDYNSTTIMS